MKRRKYREAKPLRQKRTATAARRKTEAPKSGPQGPKPEGKTSISRTKLLDVSRLDRKATLRASQSKQKKPEELPRLREETPRDSIKPKGDGKERLQKILASAGVASRRKAEELILLGHVTVNGKLVNTLGAKAHPTEDMIAVDGKSIDPEGTERVYYILNKPRGFITSTSDPQGRPTVMDLMATITARIYPVGRLDYASEGLLFFTNDGDVANKLMHPSSEVRRTYHVKIKGTITDDQLRTLRKGVQLSDGFVKPIRVARGTRLENKEWVEVQITEGKNLEIRRVFAVLDLEVDRLRRTGIGPIDINNVPVGKFVKLNKKQVQMIFTDAVESREARDEKATARVMAKRKAVLSQMPSHFEEEEE